VRRDGPKTQTGIETLRQAGASEMCWSRDGPKTQTGIETAETVISSLVIGMSRRTENPDRD